MAAFPVLKTGAVAQYPLELSTRYRTQAVQFLDGSRQTYRVLGHWLRRWQIRLDLLDDREMAALAAFVEQQQGLPFVFPDPVSGTNVANCSVAAGSFQLTATDELRGQAVLVIEEAA